MRSSAPKLGGLASCLETLAEESTDANRVTRRYEHSAADDGTVTSREARNPEYAPPEVV